MMNKQQSQLNFFLIWLRFTYDTGIVDAHLESSPANVVNAWSEFDNGGDLQKTKDEAERVNQQFLVGLCQVLQ